MTIYEKLLEVQKEIKPIVKDNKNPHFKNTYFDINTLLAEVKPILNKHGLVLTQGLTNIEAKIALETRLDFSHGENTAVETLWYRFPLPECTDAQKYGSAITYFRRYALQSLLALEAEDDDGNSAKPPVSTPKPMNQPANNQDLGF